MSRKKITKDGLIMEEVVHLLKKNYIDINSLLEYIDDRTRNKILDIYADFILVLDRDDWRDKLDSVRIKN